MNATIHRIDLSVDFSRPEHYFLFAFHILFATGSVLLAGSVVIGILKAKHLRIQNRFIFMLNTSITDTLTGFSVYYLCIFDVQEGYPSRNGTYYILPSLLGVNLLTFLFAQVDRYCAVCHPFFYKRFITRSIIICVCLYSWIHGYAILLLSNMVPVAKAAQILAFSIAVLQVVVLTKLVMTIKLFVIAKKQLARDPPSAERDSKAESLKIIIVVVINFLILWCPSFVNIIIKQVSRYGITFRNEATNLFSSMARFNALSTPALYLWGSPALRAAVWRIGWHKIFPKWKRRIDAHSERRQQ